MVNEHSSTNPSPVDLVDPEIEGLLRDAYDTPVVPRSLLKRVDHLIEADWGRSPDLAATWRSHVARSVSRKAALVRTIPALIVSATLLFALVMTVLVPSGSAWAEMLKVLKTQEITRMETPAGARSMSLSRGIVIEHRSDATMLWDLSRNEVLTRPSGQPAPHRRSLESRSVLPREEQLLLSFLVGPERFHESPGLRIAAERSRTIKTERGAETELTLALESDSGEDWELRLTLDPRTGLPAKCEILHDRREVESVALSYPATTFEDVRNREFPESVGDSAIAVGFSSSERERALALADPGAAGLPEAVTGIGVVPSRAEPPMPWQSPDAVPSRWDSVPVQRLAPEQLVAQIDSLLEGIWKDRQIEPASPADETELLRRVYLDLTGRTPTVHEVRSYLNDPESQRYERLVVRLLNSPDHASHLATVWRKVLIPEGIDLTAFGGVEAFDRWLAEQFAARKPYDEIVSELLLAEGRLSKSGPLLFYTALKLDPDEIASRTARVFLGMRLECAECHDHPFEPWTQQDFWGYAAFFAQISRPKGELERASRLMRVHDVDYGEVMLPDTEVVVAPKFLDGTRGNAFGEESPRRERLVRWLTAPANPYFARATVNRIWGQLFGKGVTDPIDNFGVQNRPRIPEIIDLLAGHLIASDFQIAEVLRAVVLSRAYQLSSGAETIDSERLEWFAQMQVKMLTAEQIYDCISVATLLDTNNSPVAGQLNLARFSNPAREQFLQQFSSPSGSLTDYQAGIPQALTLMNGTLISSATGLSSSGLLKSLEAPFFTNRERIEILYLATLSRPPRASEWEVLETFLPLEAPESELRDGLADLLWVLLNSAEFTMNH
jgi:hypothetical protein